jgi:hypothetical protein
MPEDTTPAPAPVPAQPAPPAPALQPDPTPAPPPAISPDGKLGENWFLSLGDEFAPHAKDLGKHKDLRSLITELDYFRKSGVAYPADADGDPKAGERFRAVAGVPESPEGYGLSAEALKLPEGMEFDADLAAAVSKAAHAAHTPPAALHAIAKAFNDTLAERTKAAEAAAAKAREEVKSSLVDAWRGDFAANASTVRHLANRLAESAGILPDDPAVAELANQPAFARMLLEVSKLTGEDRIHTPSGFGDLKSPAQKIAAIQDGSDPVWGAKYRNGTREEKLAAYEHIKALRAKLGE